MTIPIHTLFHTSSIFSRDIIITIITCDNDNINCVNQNNKVCLIIHIGCFCLAFVSNLPSSVHNFCLKVSSLPSHHYRLQHSHRALNANHINLIIFIERRCDTSSRVRQKSLITQGNNIYENEYSKCGTNKYNDK